MDNCKLGRSSYTTLLLLMISIAYSNSAECGQTLVSSKTLRHALGDKSIKLACDYGDGAVNNIYWYICNNSTKAPVLNKFKGSPFYGDGYSSKKVAFGEDGSSLIVHNPTVSDEGLYKCDVDRADNTPVLDITTDLRLFAPLDSILLEIPDCEDKTCTIEVNITEETNLTCTLRNMYPLNFTINWKNEEGHELQSSEVNLRENQNRTYDASILLSHIITKPEDLTCVASFNTSTGKMEELNTSIYIGVMNSSETAGIPLTEKLGAGTIAGIVVGVFAILIIVTCFLCCRYNRDMREACGRLPLWKKNVSHCFGCTEGSVTGEGEKYREEAKEKGEDEERDKVEDEVGQGGGPKGIEKDRQEGPGTGEEGQDGEVAGETGEDREHDKEEDEGTVRDDERGAEGREDNPNEDTGEVEKKGRSTICVLRVEPMAGKQERNANGKMVGGKPDTQKQNGKMSRSSNGPVPNGHGPEKNGFDNDANRKSEMTNGIDEEEILTGKLLIELANKIDPQGTSADQFSVHLGFEFSDGNKAAIDGSAKGSYSNAYTNILHKYINKNGTRKNSALKLRDIFRNFNMAPAAEILEDELKRRGIELNDRDNHASARERLQSPSTSDKIGPENEIHNPDDDASEEVPLLSTSDKPAHDRS